MLKFHLLNYVLDDLKRLGSLSFMDAGPLEHSVVLTNESHRMKAGWLPTRMQGTVETLSSAPDIVHRPESEVHGVLLAHLH